MRGRILKLISWLWGHKLENTIWISMFAESLDLRIFCMYTCRLFTSKSPSYLLQNYILKSWLHFFPHFFLYTIFICPYPPSCKLLSTTFWTCHYIAGDCWPAFHSNSPSCPKEDGTTSFNEVSRRIWKYLKVREFSKKSGNKGWC